MPPKELTLRGLVLGALLTLVFTAANVYLGLKVGLTFASSIPAAVISMAVLSVVKDSSILENNIVQTVASAAGTLSAIIFVLPGLVIVGWWTGFPFWQSFLVCLSGGVLGVLFTIPLRRALVTNSDLPYPEGVAAAEVLKVGAGTRGETTDNSGEAREGLVAVVLGSVTSAGLAIVSATRVVAGGLTGYFPIGVNAGSGYDIAWSLALVGAGHLVGLSVGMAMLAGLVIAWGVAVPILTSMHAVPAGMTLAAHTASIWSHQVRFIGAGAIGVAAIYTLGTLAKPVVGGLVSTLAASRTETTDDRDRDLSPQWIVALAIGCAIITGWLAYTFVGPTLLVGNRVMLTAIAMPFVILVGFLIAGICGYMAGLIGASNSPISGVGILSIVICASILALVIRPVLVGLCLIPAGLKRNERGFVLFAGLKGAVPILLGTFLLAAHVPAAQRLYGIIAVVVVFSVGVQGSLVPAAARLLRMQMRAIEPEPWALGVRLRDEPTGVHQLTIRAGSPADGATIDELAGLPGDAWVSFVVRDGQLVPITGDTRLRPGDDVLVLAEPDLRERLITAFEGPLPR